MLRQAFTRSHLIRVPISQRVHIRALFVSANVRKDPLGEEVHIPKIPPISREGETREIKLKRLTYQVRKRGTLENDLILSTFFHEHKDSMSDGDLEYFDKLLDEHEWDIYYWATRAKPVPENLKHPIMDKLIKHTKNEGKEARRQPNL
eukprot:Clim_evm68s210 gene=Clim_evmTU68s210